MYISRRRIVSVIAVTAATLPAVSCSKQHPLYPHGPSASLPWNFALSPDGQTVVFTDSGLGALALCNWHTGQIDIIKRPPGVVSLTWANYSSDGAKLAVVASLRVRSRELPRKLGVVDLATREVTLFETGEPLANPVFSPDGDAIVYWAEAHQSRIKRLFLFDLRSRTSRALLSEEEGFQSIYSLGFISNDTVMFVGAGPENPELKAKVNNMGARVSPAIPYFLRIGSKPEIAYASFLRKEMSDRHGLLQLSMAASAAGERVVFIGRSQTRKAQPSLAMAPQDVFVLEDGRPRQVTHLESRLYNYIAISRDGSTAAFGIEARPVPFSRVERNFDLAIVDLRTGEVTRTNFVEQVTFDSRFKPANNQSSTPAKIVPPG